MASHFLPLSTIIPAWMEGRVGVYRGGCQQLFLLSRRGVTWWDEPKSKVVIKRDPRSFSWWSDLFTLLVVNPRQDQHAWLTAGP